jgi:hypothetical protein
VVEYGDGDEVKVKVKVKACPPRLRCAARDRLRLETIKSLSLIEKEAD